jgi:pyridoxal phosphate enzyme (YggS family)
LTIAERLAEVRARIDRSAAGAGRERGSVRLVVVSKTKPESAIREAYAAGQRAFGENYAQELDSKSDALADLRDIEWHFIGHLQTNKAKIIAKTAHVVHTLDSAGLARELGKRAARERQSPLPVLLEVNVAREPQKAGVAPGGLDEVIAAVRAEPSLALRGLMTVAPAGDLGVARETFEALAALRASHGGSALLPELSMGMSNDLEVAIASGATLVRVGTAIFGPR